MDNQVVVARPNSPDEATCPSCGGAVKKRKRCTTGGQTIYFYRHRKGVGEECPLRYHPCRR